MTYIFQNISQIADFLADLERQERARAERVKTKTEKASANGAAYGYAQAAYIVRNTVIGEES